MKRILITGKNSYIGTSVEKWLLKSPSQYQINTIDMKNGSWKEHDFSKYDVVFHVAGIAHVSTDPKLEKLYYEVNRDLTDEVAQKAKADGVNQFIFMSSIIVYGESTDKSRIIDRQTDPKPSNFYGESKLQAELALSKLKSNLFKVVILRPPMIYGKGSKGNYPRLAKLAKITPLFPNIENQRSMLHIDNLCEFIKIMIDSGEDGLYFPQNKEYVKTTNLVQVIREVNEKKLSTFKFMNWAIDLLQGNQTINKLFGNLVYEKSISDCPYGDYQIRSFKESIYLTENSEKE